LATRRERCTCFPFPSVQVVELLKEAMKKAKAAEAEKAAAAAGGKPATAAAAAPKKDARLCAGPCSIM